jgi:hypothetical protein
MENNPVEPINVPTPPRKQKSHRDGVWSALILILVGVVFLVKNLNIANFTFNWWALFIFIPVFGSISSAWKMAQDDQRFSGRVAGSLGGAVVVGTVATMLLFGMDWGRFWPLMLMAVGLSMLLGGLGKMEKLNSQDLSAFARLGSWVGLAVIVLGFGFLISVAPIPSLQTLLLPRWWAIPILIAGAGALINAIVIFFQSNQQFNWAAMSMLLISVFLIGIGLLAFFALDWNILFPIVLIACGLVVLVGVFRKS